METKNIPVAEMYYSHSRVIIIIRPDRGLNVGMAFHLHAYCVWASSKGFGDYMDMPDLSAPSLLNDAVSTNSRFELTANSHDYLNSDRPNFSLSQTIFGIHLSQSRVQCSNCLSKDIV